MNKVYHRLNKKNNFIKLYLISLIPVVGYSLYKNGFLLYQRGLIDFFIIFKPLIYIIIPIIICLIIDYFKYKKINLKLDHFRWIFVSLFIPINTNILIYSLLLLIFILVEKKFISKINLNFSLLFKIILILILILLKEYNYLNLMEQNFDYAYNVLDFIFGHTSGGIASSSLIFSLITYIILSFNIYYKKSIPIVSILTYSFLILILYFSNLSHLLFGNIAGIFLAYVLFATDFKYSPYNYKGQIIYAFFLGILTVIFNLIFNIYEGVFIALIIMHFIASHIDKFLSRQKATK